MESIVHLLSQYKYLLLLPLAIVEGPIIAIIAGFLCANKLLNPAITYPVIVMGDLIGDSICYLLGRVGVPTWVKWIAGKLGIRKEKIDLVRQYFNTNPVKTISLSKITLGIGVAGIYLAGNARIPYQRFIKVCLVTSALQYVFYLTIGVLFGSAYQRISNYLDMATAAIIVAVIAIVLVVVIKSKINPSLSKRI